MTEFAANAAFVKRRAKELGADLVGIASAATLNAFPPDPRWPQTPERISPYCKSVIVLVQRIPAGAFRCKGNVPVQYIDMLVLRKMDKLAYRLAEELEERATQASSPRRRRPTGIISAPVTVGCRPGTSGSRRDSARSVSKSTSSRRNSGRASILPAS